MKLLILLTVLFSTLSFAAEKTRKVSNSTYFVCTLERDFADKKVFKKEYHFPFPTAAGETYELKGSMRWNKFLIVFSQGGSVDITISEQIGGKEVVVKKSHSLGKDPQFESFKLQVDVKKDDVVIPYYVQCSPE